MLRHHRGEFPRPGNPERARHVLAKSTVKGVRHSVWCTHCSRDLGEQENPLPEALSCGTRHYQGQGNRCSLNEPDFDQFGVLVRLGGVILRKHYIFVFKYSADPEIFNCDAPNHHLGIH